MLVYVKNCISEHMTDKFFPVTAQCPLLFDRPFLLRPALISKDGGAGTATDIVCHFIVVTSSRSEVFLTGAFPARKASTCINLFVRRSAVSKTVCKQCTIISICSCRLLVLNYQLLFTFIKPNEN